MMHLTKASQPPTNRRWRSARSMRKRRNRVVARVLTILLAVPLGLLTAAPSLVQPTEAAWQRTVSTGTGVSAVTIPAARLAGTCEYVPGIAGIAASIRIYWNPPAGYSERQAELHSSATVGSGVEPVPRFDFAANTSFSSREQRYVTRVSTGLLGSVVGTGAERELAIVMRNYGWASQPASVATNAGTVLAINISCRNLP